MKTLELLNGSVRKWQRLNWRTTHGLANGDFYGPLLYAAASVPLGLLTLAYELCGGRKW